MGDSQNDDKEQERKKRKRETQRETQRKYMERKREIYHTLSKEAKDRLNGNTLKKKIKTNQTCKYASRKNNNHK